MAQLNPYIRFDGNCRAALNFYKDCLGGELSIMTIGESPMGKELPDKKDEVMHGALMKNKQMLLMGADMIGAEGLSRGNDITISLDCADEGEINTLFSKLSAGGKVTHPLKEEFWGGIYGDFTDKYGVSWLLNYQKKPMP
jgi:PhnB protein